MAELGRLLLCGGLDRPCSRNDVQGCQRGLLPLGLHNHPDPLYGDNDPVGLPSGEGKGWPRIALITS